MNFFASIKNWFSPKWKSIPVPTEKDIDEIFDLVDDLCYAGSWTTLDSIIKSIKVDLTHTDVLMAYAATTDCCASKLPSKKEFMNKVKQVLIERGEDPRVYANWDDE